MKTRFRVGILGATGAVGQKFVHLMAAHPWFEITALLASERSAGKTYSEATTWFSADPMPERVRKIRVGNARESADVDFVFSGLDASVAGEIEAEYAARGIPVISNARNHRMEDDVPLLIPEVNPDHVSLIDRQNYSGRGFIVTNPNCSTVGVVCALKPLHDAFGLEAVHVTTLQALSGAGYPGVSSLDILGNVVPFISGEEDKIATEPLKLLGKLTGNGVEFLDIPIAVQCNRVPVVDGHTISMSVRLSGNPDIETVREAIRGFKSPLEGLDLPGSPDRFVQYLDEPDAPQPVRHVLAGKGMTVSIGRLQPCPILGIRMVALVHNTIRGAAGGALLNAEYLVHRGYLTL